MTLPEFKKDKQRLDEALTKLVSDFVGKHGIDASEISLTVVATPGYNNLPSNLLGVKSEITIKV